ncbi:30S ribosomal protein S12 methylthiotransferase RimO [Alkalibacter saccharofermentans]|uniref:Ribosomal protein uS12 methylthiotransferase RimO n=1 Tax=Alkalibacter saccharofermentans DSM 14828 TaxID=1120975 RepID=A0A1M4SDR5_9FIRM|nr:30S ribosomal protein S12 methylthiotransferase RimO [Alkalibacter saccharofermentans]SHE30384.1 SSU ribosomal protein S12P methylthiotransferase [Alkalibacter saccharofermentans DSM 14828]
MKTPKNRKGDKMTTKIAMVSLGCSKNLVDSEIMLGLLDQNSYEITENSDDADFIIINTCGFIESAKEESIDMILEMGELKRTGRLKGLIAAGCLSERYHEELMEEIPELDSVIGTGDYEKIVEVIKKIQETGEKVKSFGNIHVDFNEELPRLISTASHTAYIKIAEGCDNHCTYCIIPKLRGKYRSRKLENIVAEAKALAERGTKEIILIAQDTTMYGWDLYGKRKLADLLSELDKIQGLSWIRVMYAYPENIDDELVNVIRDAKRVLHYLDIPVQHTEDSVLKRMGRRTDRKKIFSLFEKLRREIPDMVIRSTMIAGFPGETQADHEGMLKSIKELKIDKLGVFDYSKEEGTPAAKMTDQIDAQTKGYRQFAAMEAQRPISEERMLSHVGGVIESIIEEKTEEGYSGRTWMDAPEIDGVVCIETDRELEIGSIVEVKITSASEFDLMGVLSDESA